MQHIGREEKKLPWTWPLVVLALLLAAVGWWARPRRVHEWVSVDGKHRWAVEGQPLERRMAWEPPQPVELAQLTGLGGASGKGGELSVAVSHPTLAADGAALYLALRRPPGDWDLFWAERHEGSWSELVPIGSVNTAADELAPHLSRDGRWLYFSSNRVGGEGGFDLYVCRRKAAGWSAPENLGPEVNSLADELDPALSDDGLVLYFSANRTADSRPARTTDLFAARRSAIDGAWQRAEPLAEVNSPANERTPLAFSEDHALYFASDRQARPDALVNFDLYRLRRGADKPQLEPLAPGVNTAANELAPALSPEGTRLLFASDRLGDRRVGAYGLFSSRLVEIETHSTWNTSRLQALLAVWPQAAALSLLLALVIYLAARLRGWLFERASIGRYAVLSLLLHALLLFVLALIPLSTAVANRAREILASHAPRSADDNLHQSHRAGLAAYEKLADLRSLERVATSDVPRQVLERPNVPVVSDLPAPALPTMVQPAAVANVAAVHNPHMPQQAPAERNLRTPALVRQKPALQPAQAPFEQLALVPHPAASEAAVDPQLDLMRRAAAPPTPADVQWPTQPPLPAPALLSADNSPPAPLPHDDSATPQAELLPVRRAPRDPATEAVAGEDSLPQVAGQPSTESPIYVPQTALPLQEQALAPSRHELALPSPRIAADRNAGLRSPVQLAPGSSPRDLPGPIPRAQQTILSPPATVPDDVLLVAARAVPGLADLSPDAATLQVLPNRTLLLPAAFQSLPAGPKAAPRLESPLSRTPPVLPAPPHPAKPAPTRTTVTPMAAAEEIERVDLPPAQPDNTELPPLAVPSKAPTAVASAAATALDLSLVDAAGPATPRTLVVGSMSLTKVDTPPSLAPTATRLERLPAEALPVAYAEDNVGLRAMFSLRQGDLRREYIELFGGSLETEAAVDRGLAWLAQHQYQDGHWSLHQLDPPEKNLPGTPGAGSAVSDTAASGLALLAFLGSGHTHQQGDYQVAVQRGLEWLVSQQQPDGNLYPQRAGNAWMYSHGIAAIALCEALGLTQDASLREPAQQALQFIVAAQNPATGGWRYTPGEAGDTSVVGWQVMALKSGEMAGLEVPATAQDLARRWLASAAGSGASLGTFGYLGPGGSLAMTAEGLLCQQFLGCRRDDPQLMAGVRVLAGNPPQHDRETSYYWYYATQVLYHVQGPEWDAWNERMRDLLVQTQIKEGHLAGTWDPRDQWEQAGGRLYATCLRLLILETYYRHLPLYRAMVP